jgi:hypothetical protein
MAHFAKISENNEVLQYLTLNNSDMLNTDGVEDETVGQQYLEQHNNWPAHLWIQTSYNTSGGTQQKWWYCIKRKLRRYRLYLG